MKIVDKRGKLSEVGSLLPGVVFEHENLKKQIYIATGQTDSNGDTLCLFPLNWTTIKFNKTALVKPLKAKLHIVG